MTAEKNEIDENVRVVLAPYSNEENYNQSKLTPSRKLAAIFACILASLAVILIVSGVTYTLELWGGRSVDDVSNMTLEEAENILTSKGFSISVEEVASDTEPGLVLYTNPSAGQRAQKNSQITVYVTKARVMPDVVGMSFDDAVLCLSNEGLTIIERTEVPSDEAEGTILATSPSSGENLTSQTQITLEVAISHRVPDILNKNEQVARSILEDEGYSVTVEYEANENVEAGCVVSVQPDVGQPLKSNSNVVIKVAFHRSDELVNTTRSYLESLKDISYDDKTYEMMEVNSVDFDGDNSCSYTITARPFEDIGWIGNFGKRSYGSKVQLTGKVFFSDSGNISSSEPSLKSL